MKASAKVVAAPSQTPIQVFVRVRPLNKSEKYSIVNVNNGKEVIVKERPIEKTSRNFVFDKAFGPESRQVDVYKRVVYPLIDEVLSGYNCTVFAYGQTGTGKTFTMEGGTSSDSNVSWEEDPMTGIIPRSLSHLFDELRISQLEHTVRVSFLELYNEELFDLLSPLEDSNKLRLFEDSNKKGSVIIQNLEEVPVHNKAQVYKIMEKGSQKRQTAATLMNAHSSRSHTIFSITVHIKETSEKGEELFKIGKLNLVDLAGSENIGRSGAVDKRAREAGNINQSLLTLGRVITSLVEKAPHIPYRESKLTRLLQDSLGGRTKTSIIATVSPALCNLEETLSTLEYAARAKNITNRPEINQKLTKKAFLKEYEEEINRLKRDLLASRDRNGVYVDTENYTKMTLQIEEQEREIGENLSSIKALRAEMEKRQEIIEELSTSNEKAKEEIERQKQSCRETKKVLKEVTVERDENKLLKEKHMETEEKLKKQAEQLLSVANVATVDTMKLHEKIERKSHVETNNASQCEQFCSSLQSSLGEMQATIRNQAQCEAKFFNLLKSGISNRKKTQDDSMDQIRNHLKAVCQDLSERMEKFTGLCQYVRKEKHTKLTDDLIVLKLKLDSNNSTLDTTIFEGIIPQLDDIFNHLNDLDEFLLKFNEAGENVNKDVCHLNSETQRLKKFTKEQMERHLKFLKMIKSTGENLDRFDTLLVETEKSNVEVTDKLVDVIKRAVTDYEASKEEISKKRNEILTQRSDEVEKSRSDLRDLSRNIENDIKECEPNFTGMISLVDRVQLSVNNQQATAVEKLQSWKLSESERLESVKVNIENLSTVTKESKKIFDSWSEDFDKGLIESNAKETQLEKTEAQTLLNDVSEQISQSESVLNDLSDSHQTAVTELVNNIDDRLTNSEKSRNEMSKNLCMQDNLIEKFLQEDFKMDTPTGSTPQKREFDYPHNLTVTSPHEIILARYRETMKHNLLLDDSLDESIPSEEMKKISSTESLASTTSTSLNQKENDLDTFIPMSVKKINQSVGSKKRILGETN